METGGFSMYCHQEVSLYGRFDFAVWTYNLKYGFHAFIRTICRFQNIIVMGLEERDTRETEIRYLQIILR